MRRASGRAGFSLVEVMISLLIFALIAAAGATVLTQTVWTLSCSG